MTIDAPELEFPEAAARLRRTLTAVAATTPAPDRSPELAARLAAEVSSPSGPSGQSGQRPAIPPAGRSMRPMHARRPKHPMRWLAIAASVAVLVAGGALVVRARDDDPSDVASTSGELETGWLVPPDGWTIAEVMAAPQPVGGDVACPCTMWAAARPGQDGAVFFLSEGGAVDDDARDRMPVDVGGRRGLAGEVGGSSLLWAESRGREVLISARGAEVPDLAVVADAVLDQRDAGESLDFTSVPLPEGFVGTSAATKPAWQVDHTVLITAQEIATGRHLTYMVSPPDYQRGHLLTPGPVRVEGGVIATTAPDNSSGARLVVVGGAEDLVIGGAALAGPHPGSTFTEDELRRFAAGLREVPTADWREALAPAVAEGEVDGNVLAADSLTSPPLTEG